MPVISYKINAFDKKLDDFLLIRSRGDRPKRVDSIFPKYDEPEIIQSGVILLLKPQFH